MKTPTSFGDEQTRLDLPGMRELMRKDWEQRDRKVYSSLLSRNATELPLPPASDSSPDSESSESEGMRRRGFLKLMGGSAALAGLAACTKQPKELIVPYVKQPEDLIPGKPLFYATTRMEGGYAQGLMVESQMGRPTKIEGNPLHPASLGGTDMFSQASVLDLYDPERSKASKRKGVIKDFGSFSTELEQVLKKGGNGLRLLLPSSSSATEKRLCEDILKKYPQAQIHVFDPVCEDAVTQGAKLSFGKEMLPLLKLDKAEVIVSLDHDFLGWSPAKVRYARDFTSRRKMQNEVRRNRFYIVESGMSMTGTNADNRLPVRSHRVEAIARAIAAALGLPGAAPELTESETAFVDALVGDLKQVKSLGLVTVGPQQSPEVHAIANAINATLGSIGTCVDFIEPVLNGPVNAREDFTNLVRDMRDGNVKALVMMDVNPVYAAPANLGFAKHLEQVPFSVCLSQYEDETALASTWHISSTHYLETWSDNAAFDGTMSLAQPLIAPLYQSKSRTELLSLLAGEELSAFELLQNTWKARTGTEDDEDAFRVFWRTSLHDGFIKNSAAKPWKGLKAKHDVFASAWEDVDTAQLEVVFQPDGRVWDGSYANNPWLQEVPAPVSTVTWDNVIAMSPGTARTYKIALDHDNVQSRNEVRPTVQVAELNIKNRTLVGPVLVIPGMADDTVTVSLGGGRRFGKVAEGVGYDPNVLRSWSEPWVLQGASFRPLKRRMMLALTQDHFALQADGRALIRDASLPQFNAMPDFPTQMVHQFDKKYTLYPEWDYSKGLQWGMVVDLNSCVGCNACITACQAENNIPTVGKDEVMNGRQMHWIRVDRYFEDVENGDTRVHMMPMACVHCENAPCETVCPVGATMHSSEGLNMMVYNRCVGTRYCSNNCPYKVRRFNFFKYTDTETESIKLQRNPNVTVRQRGVMEKCTYCVQRINNARIDAKVQNRELKDGDVVTACQQACPADAISFGNILDKNSRVARLKEYSLNYTILEPLNTRARTSYLGKVRNPHPALDPAALKPLHFEHGPGHHGDAHGETHGEAHGETHGTAHGAAHAEPAAEAAHGEAHAAAHAEAASAEAAPAAGHAEAAPAEAAHPPSNHAPTASEPPAHAH